MKVIASGSLVVSQGEMLEIMAGPATYRFGDENALPKEAPNEVNIGVKFGDQSNAVIAVPSYTAVRGGMRLRTKIATLATASSAMVVVFYTIFTE